MKTSPTYNELLQEIRQLKQQLAEKKKLEKEQELSLAREKAEKSERLYRRLIENSPWGMHFYQLENDFLVFKGANPEADKLLHVDNSQFIGKTIEEAFPALAQTEIPFRYREAAEKGLVWKTEQISYDDNKITGAFEVIAFQTTQDNMVAVFNDITERKRVEEELKKSEFIMRTAIENLPIIFYMIDNDGIFKLSIGAGLQSLGLQPNQVVGLSAFKIYKDHPHIIESVKKALSGEIATFESNVSGAIHFNIVTPFSISDKKNGIVGVALDITERKQIELEAIQAKEKAEENDRLKTAFLQNMSHEIRTPMNAIIGFASLMAENCNNSEKLKQFSSIIEQRSHDLLAIINDMLDISKIESGQGTLQMEECNLNELFSELALFFADYQSRADKQHIQLLIHQVLDEDTASIITDQHKLKQILINLITNAFKYTESGIIECGCKRSSNQLLFHVSDTGVGIPGDKHEFIFERFTRIDTVISKSFVGGTGLGLPIVKGLVGLLGGKVWLESERNKGTTFYFTINYKEIKRANSLANSSEKITPRFAPGKSILIVEDDPNNALYLEEVLRDYFSEVYVVGTGLDAIKLIHKQSINLVLMDVRLPDITGYEATKTILKDLPGMKIIAQTAYAATEERIKAIHAGCVDYISKPANREQLLSVMSQYLK